MPSDIVRDPALEWLDHVQPVGLVVAPAVLKDLILEPIPQHQADSAEAAALIDADTDRPALKDHWAFVETILGWDKRIVAGAPGGPELPTTLSVRIPEHDTTLAPSWAVMSRSDEQPWQLLVSLVPNGIDLDQRGALEGWEATAHQRFERLLRESGVFAGVLVSDRLLRLIYAPRGETSGWIDFPIRPLATVAGRAMLGGLKLMLDRARLFTDGEERRLPAVLRRSREAQAAVSTALAGQVLGALHELLRGLDSADSALIRELAASRREHLYEGLLSVLLRLVFTLYAEDRDLLPSLTDARARELYEQSYSLRGLYAKLVEDAALNPDTMDQRFGGWGRLIALFRLIHRGHGSGFIQPRGGKLFDSDTFPFLEGRRVREEAPRILTVSDGCVLRVLESLMTLEAKGRGRERLSYRTLDVEQIGSVYETVMGFTVRTAGAAELAIRAGKNNRTPVFVDLTALAAAKPADRVKLLAEAGRSGKPGATLEKALKAATSVEDIAAALDAIVDERASPRKAVAPGGAPILQPTDERRRTGSHYTPRSLTEPIVRHALEPAFERLGEAATPAEILDLKVCDPAMGSGAFLVEACRQLGTRLVRAWAYHKATPPLPPDEDEDLHARRLVAQRCLYGVDKNPLATDLAKLSLWLATLARDHEFTFLDHALKTGDSLVGLSARQIAAAHWDETKPGLPLFRQLVKDRVAEAKKGRAEIQSAPDNTLRAIQEARHRSLETRLDPIRVMGDAVVAAFFAADKPRARERQRQEVESLFTATLQPNWTRLDEIAGSLRAGEHPLVPFHWHIEFPEVFSRESAGFDAIVGNPPFAGKNTTIAGNRPHYLPWLQTLHEGAHGNADLVAHFFRRAFELLRFGGTFGLIATNTIGQGDTRDTGLAAILGEGGAVGRATRRLQWPGEAAVVVSVAHVAKGSVRSPILDGRQVRRISAYLVEGELDRAPSQLSANSRKAFIGSYVLGMGFTFDDVAAANGEAESLDTMRSLIARDAHNSERILPYIGGEEVNNSPTHAHHRFAIDFADFPLRRAPSLDAWKDAQDNQRDTWKRSGIVPLDYPQSVASDWPDLLEIVERRVRPTRLTNNRERYAKIWWQYAERRPGLVRKLFHLPRVLAIPCGATPHLGFAQLPGRMVWSHLLFVFGLTTSGAFASLQCRVHEVWARSFGSSMKDDLRYTPSDCFETFPFSSGFEESAAPEAAGRAYHDHRAALMVTRNEGMTKTYNRFHDRDETSGDILRLRDLHADMDRAVLESYGWPDLAERAEPIFLDKSHEDDHTYQGRLFWPSDFRDEVLARLLALNAERHAEEVRLGIAPGMKGAAPEVDEESVAVPRNDTVE